MGPPSLRCQSKDQAMTKKELAKHEWILETQMFQRIARVTEDSYEHLSNVYDKFYKNSSLRDRQF